MATWDDARRLALALPEVTEKAGATAAWQVRRATFAWERPLRRGDLAALADLLEEAWLAKAPKRLAQRYLEDGNSAP